MAEQTPSSSPRYRIAVCAIMSTALALFFLAPTVIILDLIRRPFSKSLYGAYWLLFFLALTLLSTIIEFAEPHARSLFNRFRDYLKKTSRRTDLMNRMFFTAKYCLQELPLIVAQSATAGVGGMLIGVAVSSILKTDPLISCQNGCVITSCLVACLTFWETIKRSRDNQLTR